MKPILFPRISLILALATGLTGALADTITLKDGSVLKGNIVEETSDSWVMEVSVSASIKDTKKIKKADVAKVDKEAPADKEAAALLLELKTIPDGLTAPEYEKRIKKLQPWLDKNKSAKSRPEMESLLKLYIEEQARIKAGDVKLRGTWITAEEAKWNEYNISARKLRADMEELFKKNKPLEAYQKALEMEANYVASVDFPPTVDMMKKKLPAVQDAISRAIEDFKLNDQRRKAMLAQLTPEKKKETDDLLKKELTEFKAKITQEKKDKISIPSFYPYDLKSIQDSLAAAKKEEARLGTLDTAGMMAANKKFEQGLKDMNTKAFLSARNCFEYAAKFHTKDAGVKKKLDEATKAVNDAKARPGSIKAPVR